MRYDGRCDNNPIDRSSHSRVDGGGGTLMARGGTELLVSTGTASPNTGSKEARGP